MISYVTVWSVTVSHAFLNKHNAIIPILVPWLYWLQKYCYDWRKAPPPKKSQSVNSCIKPVHFSIYRVGHHLCTCYILSHSGKISSPSDSYWHVIIFWISFIKRKMQKWPCQCPRYRRTQTKTTGHLTDTVHSRFGCVKQLCAWTPGAWRTYFGPIFLLWQPVIITAWNNSVSERFKSC